MATPAPNSAQPTPGTTKKKPKGGNQPFKQRFYNNPFANRNFGGEFFEKPYGFYPLNLSSTGTVAIDPFQCIVNKDKDTEALPNGWKLYFHDDELGVLQPDLIVKQVKYFRDFLKDNPAGYNYKDIFKTTSFEVDVKDLEKSHWTTFTEDLKARPEHTINCLSFAMHLEMNQHPSTALKRRYMLLLTPTINYIPLPIQTIQSLSMDDCGSLVRIRGNVIQSIESTIEWIWRTFQCGLCDQNQVILQRDGKPVMPSLCKGCNHRGKDYSIDFKAHFNVAAETQILRLQESREESRTRNDVPMILEIQLSSDKLLNKIAPGTDVLCTGVLKSRVEGDQDRRHYLYLDVIHLQVNGDSNERNFDYTASDHQVIERMKEEDNPFRLLVQSLCPKIIGQEMVKAALILGMFSVSPEDFKGTRREAHILLIGDPGLGKSELLEAAAAISPRGVFVSSNSCTNTGLTASMSRDAGQKSTVEAGALVMADQGVCCIDELDKISASMDALLEAMEDQVVNIAKAGVINKLRAKTSIMAAANPIGGHYNKTKRITDNIKISLPVISRFDLVLVLIDQNNSDVEKRFMKRAAASSSKDTTISSAGDLESRLKLSSEEDLNPLPPAAFQKYLSYMNRNFQPELSPEAKVVIKEYYLKLRRQPFYSDIIPVTTRAPQSLIRLTQARAKIDFAEVATKHHAEDVTQLVEFGMRDVRSITEEDIVIQANLQSNQPKQSKAEQLSNFTRILQIRAKGEALTLFSKSDLKEMANMAGVRNVNEIIDLMNVNGVLLIKDSDTYQFVNC